MALVSPANTAGKRPGLVWITDDFLELCSPPKSRQQNSNFFFSRDCSGFGDLAVKCPVFMANAWYHYCTKRQGKKETSVFHPWHAGSIILKIQVAWQILLSWVTTASSLPSKTNLLWTSTSTTLSWKGLVSPQKNSTKLETFRICCHTNWARRL